jgi:hypothetical protein
LTVHSAEIFKYISNLTAPQYFYSSPHTPAILHLQF